MHIRTLFWIIAVAIAIAFTWFISNLLYSLLWQVLDDWGFPATEAKMTAYIAAHLLPFLLMLSLGTILWFVIRPHIAYAKSSQTNPTKGTARYSDKDASLIDTIWWIAESSAWGRWQTAQRGLWANERDKLVHAASFVVVAAKNGELIVRGRRGSFAYEPIDRDFWRRVYINIQSHPASLWKTEVARYDGDTVPLPDYDHFLVEWRAVELLWPGRNWRLDWLTAKLRARTTFRTLRSAAIAKMEPAYIIILGLVIAAAGVAWQLSRGKPSLSEAEIAKVIAPFQAQIDALKATEGKPFWNTGGAPTSPPQPKRYTAYEKEQRLRAVDELYNVLTTKLSPAYAEGRDLFNGINNAMTAGNVEQKLNEHYIGVKNAFDELSSLQKKYEYFPDIVQATKQNTFNGLTEMVAAQNLVGTIDLIKRVVEPSHVLQLIDRDVTYMEARNANRDFETYLKDTMPRLQKKRTEIEAAEIVGSTK